MKTFLALLFFVATSLEAAAQLELKLLEFKLSDSFEDENKKAEPARFVATIPGGGNRTEFLIDLAGSLEFMRYKSLRVSTFGEWHRKTMIPIEQHVQQLGFGVRATLWNELGNCKSCFAVDVDIAGRYSHNLILSNGPSETGIYTAYVTPYWLNKWKRGDFLRPTATNPEGTRPFAKVMQFSYVVFGGLEYMSGEQILMPNLTARAEIYPLSAIIQQLTGQYGNLVARFSYTLRENLTDEVTELDIGNLFTYGVRAQHKFSWQKSELTFGAGYDYSRGPDPIRALKTQAFGTFVIKVKLILRATRTFSP